MKLKLVLLISFVGVATGGVFLFDPIAQDPGYHNHADSRPLFGIPNFWNVATGAPFLVVGALGLRDCLSANVYGGLQRLKANYMAFFAGIFMIGVGSAYYHMAPSNSTLVWDRLPMTMAFMSFFSIVIAQCISPTYGRALLLPLIVVGSASVGYWHATEFTGAGDLRPYALVQFLPMAVVPLILVLFASPFRRIGYLWAAVGTYALAKVAEHFDSPLFLAFGVISGHSIKHLLAALSALWLLLHMRTQNRLETRQTNRMAS